jgi:hypothetical protein
MKERLNIKSEKEKIRMAKLAFERGSVVNFSQNMHFGEQKTNIILEFNGSYFIFADDGCLVTVIKDENFQKTDKRAVYQQHWSQGELEGECLQLA